ncbi:hypothetical protein SPRG_00975 [Saprolegnia parasitica CBS 223.65]|uniref:Cyclic nucleotide-binding domain-containing protein n=1 Tax=Saprolegnia parasitica (strain CBS 223.65) TaxID=695850 RepID=A0A067CW22_SAPPC|nr:hypothetical protein SPRG_00975 [Saprolegnia parasitica CBS 223.65]KDO34914.1 hypothetical protein SPRG_00975 [Saprolegnia parasitica CBS 223.65]|eukprot:XP_012194572.1 hypothetical protein SPRG_00975 [Saprolegnia parasitica CBS 223.65]
MGRGVHPAQVRQAAWGEPPKKAPSFKKLPVRAKATTAVAPFHDKRSPATLASRFRLRYERLRLIVSLLPTIVSRLVGRRVSWLGSSSTTAFSSRGGSTRSRRRRSRYNCVLDAFVALQKRLGVGAVVSIEVVHQLYILFSVPYRVGFLFDPYDGHVSKSNTWWLSLYLLAACDVLAYGLAICSLLHSLVDRRKLAQVKPRTIDVFSMMRHTTNAQAAIVKFSMTRQESLRRRSSFLSKEASMKPEFLLSASWDAGRAIRKAHIALQLVALIPFQLVSVWSPNLLHVTCLPMLLRVEKAAKVARALKRSLAENERLRGFHNAGMSLLLTCVALNFVAMHWYACIFMLVNHIECGYESNACGVGTSWAARNHILGPKLLHTYVYSLVVAGYGFLIPETNVERVFVVLIQVGRYIAFVGVVSAFVFLFECQNSRRNHFSDKVDGIKGFLVDKRVAADIKAKVLAFYEHFWTAQRGIPEATIVASLPSHIQSTFLHHLRARLLKSVPILRAQPVHIINRLVFEMRRQSYSPRDWVLFDERCEHLYLMGRGRIAIMHAKSDDILDGQYFGLSMLVPEHMATVRARAETYCEVYTLTRQDIYDVCLKWDAKQITFDAMVDGVRESLVTSQRSPTSHVAMKKFPAANAWFMPTSRFRKHWEWGIMIALLFFAIDIPYRLCFARVNDLSYTLFSMRTTLDVFLFCDVIFQSRYFAFVHDERIVIDRDSIFLYYKEHGMVLDYISNLPFAIVVDCLPLSFKLANAEAVLVLHMCEWIRFLRMRHLLPTINRVLKKLQVNDTTCVLVYLFCCLPIVCHMSSCLWYLLATWNSASMLPQHALEATELTRTQCLEMARVFNNCTWLLYDNVVFGVSNDYVRAFYWSVVSLVTVQFGSILPFTTVECIYMFAWIFVGSILNYGAIGALVNAVTRMNASTEAKDEHLKLVHRFMHAEGVSRHVHRDVSSYFKHRWTSSTEQQILTALAPLPDNLRRAIQLYLHAKAVASIQLLQDIDKNELKHIYDIMAHRSYKKDEVLVRAGDVGDELYIITRGAVELTLPINGVPTAVMVVHEGACIGEAQFLARTPYPLTATVVSPSIDVSVLHKLDFDDIAKQLEGSMEDIEAQSILIIKKELAWLASIRANLDRRKIRHAMHRANSTGLFSDPTRRSMYVDPGMNVYRVWECVLLIAVLYNVISIAYRIAFLMSPTPATMSVFSVLDYATDVLFVLDMYIKLNHLTFSDRYGDQVTEVSRIRWHYLQSRSFKLDVLGSLPLYYAGDYEVMTLCRLPRLVRCLDLRTLWGDISHYIHEHVSADRIAEYLELFKLFIVLVLGSHIAGAGLYFVSTTEVEAAIAHGHEPHHIWYLHDKVVHEHHHEVGIQYLRAFYWGLGVLSSFDFMDIEVTLLAETLWFCAIAIVGVLFLGVVIGQTSTSIYNASKDTRELELHIERFTHYARSKNLPRFLLERGKLFFRFQHDCSKGLDAHEVFGDLPHHLYLDLFKDLYTTWVRNVPYFSGLQPAHIYSIAAKLRQELYLPGDDMVLEGDVASHFFIMKRGRAEKYLKTHRLVIAPVEDGVVFGEDGFFLDMRYSYSVRAVKCSE